MKSTSLVSSIIGNKLRLALVAGTLLIGGGVAAASVGVNVNPFLPASQTPPQTIVEPAAAIATPEPTNSPDPTPAAVTASQSAPSTTAQVGAQDAAQVAPAPQMGKCRATNGDGSIKYDATEHPVMIDCQIPVTTPAPTPAPTPTPAPVDNSGTAVSNPNH